MDGFEFIDIAIEDALKEIGEAMVQETKKKIIDKKKIASRTLLNSIDYIITEDAGNPVIQLIVKEPADKYATYVELGRRPGKQPPLEAIKNWTRYKGINPKYAFVIARSIGKEGIKPSDIFKEVYEKYLPKIINLTEEEISEEIENFIVSTLEKQQVQTKYK